MAILRLRGKYIHLQYYNPVTGKTSGMSLGLPDTKEGWAQARQIQKYYEVEKLGSPVVKKIKKEVLGNTLTVSYQKYINHVELSKSTIQTRTHAFNHLVTAIGDKDIHKVTDSDNRTYIKHLKHSGLSRNSIAIYTSELHSFFQYLVKHKQIEHNPIKITKRKLKPIKVIPEEDMNKIFDFFKTRDKKQYYYLMFLKLTGQRKGDATEVRWEWIDWHNNIINLSNLKKDREYYFPIHDELLSLLNEIGIKQEGKIFDLTKQNLRFFERVQKGYFKKVNGKYVRQKPLLQLSNYYTLHQFRKTLVTNMLELGLGIKETSELVDHRDISTTNKYYNYVSIKKLGDKINNLRKNY